MSDDERGHGFSEWMWVLAFFFIGCALGIWWGSGVANERCCERTCDGNMYSCDKGECLCNGDDGTIYRGWELPE